MRPQLALQVNRDPRVTEQVRQHLLQQLLISHPEQAPQLRAALQLDWLRGFTQVFGEPYGLDANNLPLASYFPVTLITPGNVDTYIRADSLPPSTATVPPFRSIEQIKTAMK